MAETQEAQETAVDDDLATQSSPVFTLGTAPQAAGVVLTIRGREDRPAPDLLGATEPATLRAQLEPEDTGTFLWAVVSGPGVLSSVTGREVQLSRGPAAEEGVTVTVRCSFFRGEGTVEAASQDTGSTPADPAADEPAPAADSGSESEVVTDAQQAPTPDSTATHELTLGEAADALVEGIEIVPGGEATELPETVVTGRSFKLRVDIDPVELTSRVSILWEVVKGTAELQGRGLRVKQSFTFRSRTSDTSPRVAANQYPSPGQKLSFTPQSGWLPAVWEGHAGFIGPGVRSRVEETTDPLSPEVEVIVGEGEEDLQVRCTVSKHGQEIAPALSPEFPVHQQRLTLVHGDQAPPAVILIGEEVTVRASIEPDQAGHWEQPTLVEGAEKVSVEVVPPAGLEDHALTLKIKGVAACDSAAEKAVVEVVFNSDVSGVATQKRLELSVSELQWVTPPPEKLMLNGTAAIKADCVPVDVPGDYTWELASVAETPAGTYAGPQPNQTYPRGETVLVGLAECPPDSLTFDCVLTTASTGYEGRIQRVLSVAGLLIREANDGEPRDPPSSVNPGEPLTLIAQAADSAQDDSFSWEVEVQGEGQRLTPTAAVGREVTFGAVGPSAQEGDVTIRCTQSTTAGEVTGEHRLSVIGLRIDELEETEDSLEPEPQGAPEVDPGVTLLRYGGTRELEVVLTPPLFQATPEWTAQPDKVVVEPVPPSITHFRASMPQPADGEVQLTCRLTSPDTGRLYTAERRLHLWSETPVDPPWLTKAREELELGVSGNGVSNPRIKEYFDSTDYEVPNGNTVTTGTSWCSAFVNWCLQESGNWPRTDSAMAVSWAKTWPEGVNLGPDNPRHGAIVVYWKHQTKAECEAADCNRKSYWDDPPDWMYGPECYKGHVGFCVGKKGDHTVILGGNQNNAVNLRAYVPADRIIGYVFPPNYTIPANAANLQEVPEAPIKTLVET